MMHHRHTPAGPMLSASGAPRVPVVAYFNPADRFECWTIALAERLGADPASFEGYAAGLHGPLPRPSSQRCLSDGLGDGRHSRAPRPRPRVDDRLQPAGRIRVRRLGLDRQGSRGSRSKRCPPEAGATDGPRKPPGNRRRLRLHTVTLNAARKLLVGASILKAKS
jgi:hypothetical protein